MDIQINNFHKIYVIIPYEKGHYKQYVRILKKKYPNLEVIFSYEFAKLFFKSKNNYLIFLNGDIDILKIFVLRFFCFAKIDTIIYYGLEKNHKSLKSFLKKIIINFLSKTGVRILDLEGKNQSKNIKRIYDPCLLIEKSSVIKKIKKSEIIRYLISGYIDERKNINQLILALDLLCELDNKKREVVVLGVIDNNYNIILPKSKFLKLKLLDKQFSNNELANNIKDADIIWVAYKKHRGSSGMFINSVFFERKIAFISEGKISSLAKELRLKGLKKEYDLEELSDYLRNLEKEKNNFYKINSFKKRRNDKLFLESFYEKLLAYSKKI